MTNRFERFLFHRIEIWIVLLLIPLLVLLLAFYGAMVKDVADREENYGALGHMAYALASVPSYVREIATFEDPHSVSANMSLKRSKRRAMDAHSRFKGHSGFNYFYKANSGFIRDYLLLSRYDGDKKLNVVELFDLNAQKSLYSWPLIESKFRKDTFDNPFIKFPNSSRYKLLAKHPVVEKHGSLVFHGAYSPLYSVDACGSIEWHNADFAYHHSLEKDRVGNYWVPGLRLTQLETFDEDFKDDHAVKLSSDGLVMYSKSVTKILIENDLINRMYVYDKYIKDPIHLNDIEPVTEDAGNWKRGDILLSLGHMNMIMLFRPSTNKVIWWSQDAINHQHDIDIVGDGKISVYNNNRTTRADGDILLGLNELLVFDISSGTHAAHYQPAFEKHEIRTINQGLHDFSSDGRVMIDETNYGRVLMVDEDGKMHWQFVNRASNGKIYTTNWVRLLPNQHGRSVAEAVEGLVCD